MLIVGARWRPIRTNHCARMFDSWENSWVKRCANMRGHDSSRRSSASGRSPRPRGPAPTATSRRWPRELGQLPVDAAIPLARAFTHFLNLANVAEQHHRIRRRRAYLRDPGSRPQRGSPEETFARLVARGVSPDALHDAICALQIELVLTAHPTEVSRRTLIHKHNRVAALLAEGDRTDLTVPERSERARGAPSRDPLGVGHG